MNTYDFRALNDKEFESLAVDLISVEQDVRIERFKPGKDSGIDGRWFAISGHESVVQCKHWIGSGVDKLVVHLAKIERPKLDQLEVSRYIIATSVPLSRLNKQRIATAMAPYIATESDIFGAEDLNDLLARHPNVERRHYKLWLSSSNTISLLLNNAIIGRSRAELEQIRHEAPLYVFTAHHDTAAQHLADKRVLLLTGEPGIGKTTLARQLVLERVADGFELVVLEESISEAENVFADEHKQMFYFDDFLGRTFLEAIRAKQDSHILRFMMRVARDPRKRFILTSRTNILNQGVELSDIYSDGHVVKNTYELKIGHLSKLDRARILYNHIWHSGLGEAFIDELYENKRYHQIIDHHNYNPRLVAFVVDTTKISDLTPETYWSFVVATFKNPTSVWAHFFSAQMSQDDRDLTYIVVLSGGTIRETELRDGFLELHSQDAANKGLLDSRYWKSIRHTSGSVLDRSMRPGRETAIYSLYNPSIADYVQAQLVSSNLWGYYFSSIRTPAALSHLEQMRKPLLSTDTYRDVLRQVYAAEAKRGHPRDEYNLRLTRILAGEEVNGPDAIDGLARWTAAALDDGEDVPGVDFGLLLGLGVGQIAPNILKERASDLAGFLAHSYLPLHDPEPIAALLLALKTVGDIEAYEQVRAQVVAEWLEEFRQDVRGNGVLSSYLDPEEAEEAQSELERFIATQLADMGVDLSASEAVTLYSVIDVDEVIAHNIEVASREDDSSDERRGIYQANTDNISAVDDLFDRSNR